MSEQTNQNGKGDRNRSISKKFSNNYDEINWGRKKTKKELVDKVKKQGGFKTNEELIAWIDQDNTPKVNKKKSFNAFHFEEDSD